MTSSSAPPSFRLDCVVCGTHWPATEVRYRCDCGGVLDVTHLDRSAATLPTRDDLDARRGSLNALDRSGVWRYRELVLPVDTDHMACRGEGNTSLYAHEALSAWAGVSDLRFKHEGENPTGSFKDRGMTSGITMARALGQSAVACASTGNTSASMAAYAAYFGLRAFVFIPDGAIAFGKLAQALAYGALTFRIRGDFDDAMRLVETVAHDEGIYLLNSINPFRLEGQKAIGFEMLQDLGWQVPDWVVVPGGNLGNGSAIIKGMRELLELGWIDRLPRLAVVQAAGASPLVRAWKAGATTVEAEPGATTLATAIRIGAPVSGPRVLAALRATDGVVTSVTDVDILQAKARIDRAGIGAEPASCATLAGVRALRCEGVIGAQERVVCVLTGHVLKDPEVVVDYHTRSHPLGDAAGWEGANTPIDLPADPSGIARAIRDALRDR